MVINPPQKKRPEASDAIETLQKNGVITPLMKQNLTSLFAIRNNCAHPKETVNWADVKRLVEDGRSAAAAIR